MCFDICRRVSTLLDLKTRRIYLDILQRIGMTAHPSNEANIYCNLLFHCRGDEDDGTWEVLKSHWNMALRMYHNSLKKSITDSNSSIPVTALPKLFDFDDLLRYASAQSRKPMRMQLHWTELDARIPLKKCLSCVHMWMLRMLDKSLEMSLARGLLRTDDDVSQYVEHNKRRINNEHLERETILQVLADCLHTASIDVFLDAQSGSDITVSVEDAKTTMPLSVLAVCPLNPFCASIRPLLAFLMRVYAPTQTERIHATMEGDDVLVQVRSKSIVLFGVINRYLST